MMTGDGNNRPPFWQAVDYGIERAPILGGWLVRTYFTIWDDRGGREDRNAGITFVPDPKHVWSPFFPKTGEDDR